MKRQLLPFLILPIIINVMVFCSLAWAFWAYLTHFIAFIMQFIPQWLEWIRYLIVILSATTLLLLYYFIFTTLANFIAAPFNALLSEKVEAYLTGEASSNDNFIAIIKDIPRMLKREWQKFTYNFPRLIGLFFCSYIPLLGAIISIITFIFNAWLLAIQYCDYPFDNHKIPFTQMRAILAQRRMMTFSFGFLLNLGLFLPLANLFIMPVAVCGATSMWINEFKNTHSS